MRMEQGNIKHLYANSVFLFDIQGTFLLSKMRFCTLCLSKHGISLRSVPGHDCLLIQDLLSSRRMVYDTSGNGLSIQRDIPMSLAAGILLQNGHSCSFSFC